MPLLGCYARAPAAQTSFLASADLLYNSASRADFLLCFRRPEIRHVPHVTQSACLQEPCRSRAAPRPRRSHCPPRLCARHSCVCLAPQRRSGCRRGVPSRREARRCRKVPRCPRFSSGRAQACCRRPVRGPCGDLAVFPCLSCYGKCAYKAVKPTLTFLSLSVCF